MPKVLSPETILITIGFYFTLLVVISYLTGRKSDHNTFFLANRNSPWYLVAFGMVGASLSGVTFISIPGAVGAGGANQGFSYMQIVFGYLLGYAFIAHVLLPIYYRLNLTTIYGYLNQRFGKVSYKTGAAFFLLSRVIGASFRLFLVAIVLHQFVLQHYGISFALTVILTILLIWLYTFRGGIKTIVITDTVQTVCMLAAVILTIFSLTNALQISVTDIPAVISESSLGKVFHFKGGWEDPNNFWKQFISGALMTIVMTGLDQDMMQKNLTCRNLKDAQKNVYSLSWVLVPVNLLFLILGALLYIYAGEIQMDMPDRADLLYPTIVFEHLGPTIGIVFILGLIAAAYSSADSALTSLTTSFCIDFLGFESSENKKSDAELRRTRYLVHLGFSFLLFLVIILFKEVTNESVINGLFKIAGFTYGPLLGMFTFGLFSKRIVRDKYVYMICILALIISYGIDKYSAILLDGFTFGFFILALNGLLTFLGLFIISTKNKGV